MATFAARKKRIEEAYGFALPECLYAFWDFAKSLSPLEPLKCLEEPLGIVLVGPYEILEGKLDGYRGDIPLAVHWRYPLDPPEFITLMASGNDGWHAGLYCDLPDNNHFTVASYYAGDGLEFSNDGRSLFTALLRYCQNKEEDLQELEAEEDSHGVKSLDKTRRVLDRYLPKDALAFPRRTKLKTLDGIGVVVPKGLCQPVSKGAKEAYSNLWTGQFFKEVLAEAKRHLQAGAPGSALQLAKDIWVAGEEAQMLKAAKVMQGAYKELDRLPLQKILELHLAWLGRPGLDILFEE